MRKIKYLGRLLKEFWGYAMHYKAYWILPVILMLLLISLLIVAGQSVAPFIYTLF